MDGFLRIRDTPRGFISVQLSYNTGITHLNCRICLIYFNLYNNVDIGVDYESRINFFLYCMTIKSEITGEISYSFLDSYNIMSVDIDINCSPILYVNVRIYSSFLVEINGFI